MKGDLVLRRIGSEYVIVVPDNGAMALTCVYTLNETAAWLWEQLENRDFTLEDMADLVLGRYETDRETAMRDVRILADRWMEKRLIEK